jgi:hypothetical protein
MWDMNDVLKIEYKEGFVYHIIFDDGQPIKQLRPMIFFRSLG